MAKKNFRIKPMAHLYHLEDAPLNANPLSAQWPTLNVMMSNNRVKRRFDHTVYRTLNSTESAQHMPVFRKADGTYTILILTDSDLAEIKTGSAETYQYRTDTYTDGSVTGISDTTVTGTGTAWDESGLAAGDQFILDTDHAAAKEGPSTGTPAGADNPWATISSITDATHLELTAAYAGGSTTGTYKARKVHDVPTGERWSWAVVNGIFCFTNGNSYTQYWDSDDDYSTDLDTTYANQARYAVAYANRLLIADMYDDDDAARNPWKLRWSKEGDPTDWTDSTAGEIDFLDTEEPIVGLGVSKNMLYVFKRTMFQIGRRTGVATDPFTFPADARGGVGLYAPYSLVNVMGTLAYMGVNDFYTINGDVAVPIGGPIREKFFSLISDDDLERVYGVNSLRYNEVLWVADVGATQYVFAWNYVENSWTTYTFDDRITGWGGFGF